MTVVMVQHVEGRRVGEHQIAPPHPDDDDRVTLEKKATSHQQRGWAIRWNQGRTGFHAQKTYPGFGRKERAFRLIEG